MSISWCLSLFIKQIMILLQCLLQSRLIFNIVRLGQVCFSILLVGNALIGTNKGLENLLGLLRILSLRWLSLPLGLSWDLGLIGLNIRQLLKVLEFEHLLLLNPKEAII